MVTSGDEDAAASGADDAVDLLASSPSSSSPLSTSLGIDSKASSTASSTLFILSLLSLINLRAATLKLSQSEEGEEEEDDADDAIEHRRERGFRVAGALHRAAIDPEGTLTRTIDVDTISDGGSKGL